VTLGVPVEARVAALSKQLEDYLEDLQARQPKAGYAARPMFA
jgi:hypothetical protein